MSHPDALVAPNRLLHLCYVPSHSFTERRDAVDCGDALSEHCIGKQLPNLTGGCLHREDASVVNERRIEALDHPKGLEASWSAAMPDEHSIWLKQVSDSRALC